MISLSGVKAVVTDIEGTTSSISFVHDILFPYARERMEDYVRGHEGELGDVVAGVCAEAGKAEMSAEEVSATLISWIDEDRKATPLKEIQGRIWDEGFRSGAFTGHMYDDAVVGLKRWYEAGLKLHVYSSGSIAAQKLLYGFSDAGDLTPMFSGYFDTTTGPKREQASYEKIAEAIGLPAAQIVLLSDVVAELEAADGAGFQTVLLDRGHELGADAWANVTDSFDDVMLA